MGQSYSREEILALRLRWRREGRSVVYTKGCYDLLHPSHVRLLEAARSRGGLLVLALHSDATVKGRKGPSRPLVPEANRATVAAALAAADAATIFDEDTPRELIGALLPDWSHCIAGRKEVEAAGGRAQVLPLEPGYSTTKIVDRMLTLRP